MKPYISYSEMSSYFWGQYQTKHPEDYPDIKSIEDFDWYKRYILGEQIEPSLQMKTGTAIHEWLDDPKYPIIRILKELKYTKGEIITMRKMLDKATKKRAPSREVVLRAEVVKGIPVMIIIDNFWKEGGIEDWKTTSNPGQWSGFKADYSDQLSLYAAVYKKKFFKYPRWLAIHELELTKGTVKSYYTARGPRDIKHINDKVREYKSQCEKLGLWTERKSREEMVTMHNKKLDI